MDKENKAYFRTF